MQLPDMIRIALGRLTAEETAERDAAARCRREQRERDERHRAISGASWHEHRRRMETAAGIGPAVLVCHVDVWRLIGQLARLHRRAEGGGRDSDAAEFVDVDIDEIGGMAELELSGPQLARILDALRWHTVDAAHPLRTPYAATVAIAARMYRQIAEHVDRAGPTADDVPAALITLDDRIPSSDSEAR